MTDSNTATASHNWLVKYPVDLVSAITRTAEKHGSQVYIVGGTVRDWLLGILARDLDLAVEKDGILFAENLASLSGGTFVLLDADNGVGRVVWKGYVVDVAEFRDGAIDIIADLAKRDFTMNAMAVPLLLKEEDLSSVDLIDPCHGKRDLQNSLIRSAYQASFSDDPLRLLRAYRFSSERGFAIELHTEQLIRGQANLIEDVSPERVTYELNKIMASKRSGIIVEKLAESGLLWHLFPELKKGAGLEQPPSHHLDVFDHNLATLSAMEDLQKYPQNYFPESEIILEYLADDKKKVWLKWAALFHDVGKPDALKIRNERITFYNHDRAGIEIIFSIGKRLKWSNEDMSRISCLVGNHMWPFHLSNVARTGQVSAKAILKLVKAIDDDLPGLFLLAMADSHAGQGPGRPPEIEKELADLFFQVNDVVKNKVQPVLTGPKLVTGLDLIDMGLTPGPLFKEILENIERAQVVGDVNDRQSALDIVRDLIHDQNLV
jgi:poly(A) polymerase